MSIVDRLAIADLFTRYCCALDAGEVETVVACFSDDAVLESPAIGRITGQAAIRDFAARFAALRAGGTQFRHFVTNIAVALDGDRARATAYLLVAISRDGSHRTLPPGRYECDLARDDGGAWHFTRRVVTHDHDYRLDAE
jgi:ketosteroid isomerase-like protein